MIHVRTRSTNTQTTQELIMFSQTRTSSLVFLFLSLCSFLLHCTATYPPSPNCNRIECVPYEVVYSHPQDEFEIRIYKTSFWISSPSIASDTYKPAAGKGFRLLYAYFKGLNSMGVKMNMTGPVIVDVQDKSYAVHFYVPTKFQDSQLMPTPTSKAIKIEAMPQLRYAAVRRFEGFINDTTIAGGVAALRTALGGTRYEKAADQKQFSVAGYSSPRQTENRVNEVIIWFD